MFKHCSFTRLFLIGSLGVLLMPGVNADPIKKRTDLTVNQPIQIPGMVLQPGNYVVKVPDPVTHADMVGFFNEDQTYLYKLVRTIPKYRLDTTDKTAFTFEEGARGAPDAIKSWFYPGDNWGKEFVYGKGDKVIVAAAAPPAPAPAPVAAEPAPEPLVAEAAPPPEPTPTPIAEAPVEVAEATPPAPAPTPTPAPAPAPAPELPKTASPMPLFALLGASSLVVGGLLKWVLTSSATRVD